MENSRCIRARAAVAGHIRDYCKKKTNPTKFAMFNDFYDFDDFGGVCSPLLHCCPLAPHTAITHAMADEWYDHDDVELDDDDTDESEGTDTDTEMVEVEEEEEAEAPPTPLCADVKPEYSIKKEQEVRGREREEHA